MQPAAQDRVERRLAAILTADVVGPSRLLGQDDTGILNLQNALRAVEIAA
jgi:hypothetical protein